MRAIFLLLLLVVVGFGSYIYIEPKLPLCRLPVEYSIGTFDERFGISREEASLALTESEAIWESSLGNKNIFSYRDDAKLKVNFIYDERQQQAESAESAREDISTRGGANEVLVTLHQQLVEEYEAYELDYETKRLAYEKDLSEYNAEVEKYNQNGGAPPNVYEDLEERKKRLDKDGTEVNSLADTLNDLALRINSIGDKGNELISEYNQRVRSFNDTYVHEHEYTQGDYQGRVINVYTFDSKRELTLVLAHELGHALAVGHVENTASVMYYLMGGQPEPAVLSEEDIEAFKVVCEGDIISRLWSALGVMYSNTVSQ